MFIYQGFLRSWSSSGMGNRADYIGSSPSRCVVDLRCSVYRNESVDDHWVVHFSASIKQNANGHIIRHPRAIGAIRCQRIEAINDRQNASTDWDVGSFQAARISAAIPVLVVMTDNRNNGVWEVDRRENVCTHTRVQFHFFKLGVS